jgi:hypothetical protein
LKFAPSNIAFDGAYDLFYVVGEGGSEVLAVDMGGVSRTLFDFNNTQGIDPGFLVASLHYAPNTGTLFVLCQECGSIVEVCMRINDGLHLAFELRSAQPKASRLIVS